MLNTYEQITPVTTADKAATRTTDMFDMQPTVNATRALTLWRSRERDEFFVSNRSNYAGIVGIHADDVALIGSPIVMPGSIARFVSDGAGNWYREGGNAAQAVSSISLTAAQIFTLNSVPVSLAPAPGTGRVLIPIGIDLQITRTATAFTGGGVLEVRYTDASGALMIATIPANFVTGAAGVAYVSVNAVVTAATPVPNAAIVLVANGSDFAAGTGTMKGRFRYAISDYN